MSNIYRHTVNKDAYFRLPDNPIFDYVALMEALKVYSRPRDKVTSLLRNGTIMRVKKGLYVAHREDWRNIPIKELAANLIYGPSYVSLQYALAFYGMIPEAAVQLTSVTFKKTKQYHTPLGDFTYRSVSLKYYLPGVVRQRTREGFSYMIAAREKALMDMLYFAPHLKSMLDVQSYILEDLRIDEETIGRLDLSAIDQMSAAGDTVKLSLCNKAINRLVRWNR